MGRASIGEGALTGFMRTLVQRVEEVDPPAVPHVETAALAMIAMVERIAYYESLQMRPMDREVMLDTVATILHQGLFGAVSEGTRRRRPAKLDGGV